MRLIIDCEPEHIVKALELLTEQAAVFHRYNKVGWGWSFGGRETPFFVRRIKNGLSIKQTGPRP